MIRRGRQPLHRAMVLLGVGILLGPLTCVQNAALTVGDGVAAEASALEGGTSESARGLGLMPHLNQRMTIK